MKFPTVAKAREHLWRRLFVELDHLVNLGVLEEEECDDEFDKRRMRKAVGQVKATIAKKKGPDS